MGPISIPMLLGLLPAFRRWGSLAALISWACGLASFVLVKYVLDSTDQTLTIATPLATSLVLYLVIGLVLPQPSPAADEITAAVSAAADIPAPEGPTPPLVPATD